MSSEPPVAQASGDAPSESAMSMLMLNYWLSVFFTWLPALIFFLIERGKNSTVDTHNAATLNFQILRTIVVVAASIIAVIPYIGWLIAMLLWIGSLVLFIFAIIAAIKGPEDARAGRAFKYPFNVAFVK